MAPPVYFKMKNAELTALLSARGLDSGGTKIQKISRLVMQDDDDTRERKATEDLVRKASGGAQKSLTAASAPGARGGTPKGDGRDRNSKKELERRAEERRIAREKAGITANGLSQNEFIHDLITTPATNGRTMSHSHDHPAHPSSGNPLPEIVVNMTPKGARGRPMPSPRSPKPFNGGKSAEEGDHIGKENVVKRGIFDSPLLGAVLVFVAILVTVLTLGVVVEWRKDADRTLAEVLWTSIAGSTRKGKEA